VPLSGAREYYILFAKQFCELFYESWRREAFAAIAVTLISYFLTLHEKGAWYAARIAVEANLILLLGFASIHLFRAPFLVHSEILEARLRQKDTIDETLELPPEITPKFLQNQFEGRTSIQAEQKIRKYLGKRMRIVGHVDDVTNLSDSRWLIHVRLEGRLVGLVFKKDWKDTLIGLRKGDPISVAGKLSAVDSISVRLQDCDLIED
jgi:hypothetical protein